MAHLLDQMEGLDKLYFQQQALRASSSVDKEGHPRLTSFSHGGGCGCKISPKNLEEILKSLPMMGLPVPPELLVGKENSDDAAVYKLNDSQAVVFTTDFFMPIVDDPFDFGRIAATNAISDVYAMGANPILALAIVCMPVNKLPPKTISSILEGGQSACTVAGIPIAGGHTIDGVEVIYGLAVVGVVDPAHVKKNSDARAGDVLVLSKPIGVGIMSAALKSNQLSDIGYKQMVETTCKLNTPGPAIAKLAGVHAITDVTGFGLGGHGMEIARASNVNMNLDWDKIPVLDGVLTLAGLGNITGASKRNWQSYGHEIAFAGASDIERHLLTDPQTSGGLLVSCSPDCVEEVLKIMRDDGFAQASVIGTISEVPAGQKPTMTVKKN